MLARLMVALLTLALAFPAMAMPVCHLPEAAPTAMAHPGHAMPAADKPAPEKPNPHADAMCIGCIAPSTARPPVVAARLFVADTRGVAPAATGAPLGHGPPATPPPRPHG